MNPVKEVVQQALGPRAKVMAPAMDMAAWSKAHPSLLALQVVRAIDAEWQQHAYRRIIFVGHSLGALIARKAYIIACGQQARAPFEPELADAMKPHEFDGRPWATAVERIVLLAAMNRGWRVSHHLNLLRAPLWAAGSLYGTFSKWLTGRWHLIMHIRRGGEFMTNLRLQWIVLRNEQGNRAGPLTIQLLGSIDDLVAPNDNIDLVSGGQFVYLDVPMSSHTNIIEVNDPQVPQRRELLTAALTESESQLREKASIPSDDPITEPDLSVTNVVFVIHGIRDAGYWTHKLARRVRTHASKVDATWATETSSYGYFPMLPFLLASGRREKVEWLMDQYADALARYPRATFHYVGHSNGTYLLAKALKLYRACRFDRVVFAGSVVRRNYEWHLAVERKQVRQVLNFVASGDWVVAWFPKLFEQIRIQDLGSAGHDGFKPHVDLPLQQVKYVRGGHGAAIEESMWEAISCFITQGHQPAQPAPLEKRRAWWVTTLGYLPGLVWVLIGCGLFVAWTGWRSWTGFGPMLGSVSPVLEGFGLAGYFLLLLTVLRRI
jgi:pimeloyl-ACP methyl ester carboxylesterase